MSQLYPTARQLGVEPSKPLPASRPARPAQPVKPAKGAQQKASMLTPWDRKVTVKRSDVPEKQKRGYEFQGYKTVPPQGLNKPRPAVKQSKPPVKSKDVDYVPFNEFRSFKQIIENILNETKVGDTFNSEGSRFIVTDVKHEQNKNFEWDSVTAIWSGFGPMPVFSNQPKKFVFNRTRKSDGYKY